MHDTILNPSQQSALALLNQVPEVGTFYLAGGTALALHLGHRESVDFDFFRERGFAPQELLRKLPGPMRVLQEERDTFTVDCGGVKISFFGYPHSFIKPLLRGPLGVAVADIPDIAAMELAAIAGRGSRKDFVDLFFIARQCFPLKEAFLYLQMKFLAHQYDLYHILRSLTYFSDAEREPMPLLCSPVPWEEMKRYLTTEATRLHR